MNTTSTNTKEPPVAPILLRDRDAAALLGVSKSTVYRAMREGRLKTVRIGRVLRFRREDIEAMVAASIQ